MSLMVTCPTCQATLRVPPEADTIRCPQCKTVLALQPAVAAPPVPPPPPPVKPAIPLPFGRPPVAASPPPAARPPEPPPPRGGKVTRGKIVEEDDDEGDDDRRPKRREKSDEEKLEALMDRVEEEARPARVGMTLMAYGAFCASLSPMGVVLFFVSTLMLQSPTNPFVWLPVVGVCGHWILSFVGFCFCCFGLKAMRPMAIAGVSIMLFQALSIFALVRLTLVAVALESAGFNGLNSEAGLIGAVLLGNLFNNLSGVTNLPLLILFAGNTFAAHVFVVVLVGGAVEFAKLSLVGVLANHYAIEGKARELGYQSIRFVYRIIWVVIIGFVGELLVIGFSYLGFGFIFLSMPSLMMLVAYFLWCAFAWVAQGQVLLEVTAVTIPERITDKRADLDQHY